MPAVNAVLLFCAGIITAAHLPLSPVALWIAAAALLVPAAGIRAIFPSALRTASFFTALLLITAGAAAFTISSHALPAGHYTRTPALFGGESDIIADVVSLPEQRPRYAAMAVRLISIRDSAGTVTPVTGIARLSIPMVQAADYAYGMRLHIRGTLSRPEPARNPGAFDYRQYLARQQVYGLLSAGESGKVTVISTGHGNPLFTRLVGPLKRRVTGIIEASVSKRYAPLLGGMLLGDRGTIDKEILGAFADSGVIHVLAVSGLHVGLVALIFMAFFKLIRLPFRAMHAAAIITLLLYMMLTGMKPSVVRATIMAVMVLAGILLERDGTIANTIAAAALFILMLWPQSLFDVGFQLSFAATIGIIYLYPHLTAPLPDYLHRTGPKWLTWIVGGFIVSLAAQLGTAPFTLYYFNRVAVISLAANIVAIPTVFCAVSTGFAMVALGFIHPVPAKLLGTAIGWLLQALETVVRRFASAPCAYVEFGTPSLPTVILLCIIIATGITAITSARARRLLLPVSLAFAGWLVWQPVLAGTDRTMDITFLDAGPGLCAHIRLPDGQDILINTGTASRFYDAGERVVVPYLTHRGIRRLDAVIMTGLDDDHVGGFAAVQEKCSIGRVADSGHLFKSRAFVAYRDTVHARQIPYSVCMAGDSLRFGDLRMYVLHPDSAFCTELGYTQYGGDNTSLALMLVYGQQKMLLTGNPGPAAWQRLQPVLHNDTFKAVQIPIKYKSEANTFGNPHMIFSGREGSETIRLNGKSLLRVL